VRDFRGFSSLKEVECTGSTLQQDVNYLSLTLFRPSDNSVLATLVSSKDTCHTFSEFASCFIDTADSRKSVVRTLVTNLEGEERTVVACNVTSVFSSGHPKVYTWTIAVYRESK
jgi:hypothetical protein